MKWIKYVEGALLGISVITLIYFLVTMVQGTEDAGVDIMLKWAYVMLAVCVLVAIIFPVVDMFTSPKGAGKTLLYFVGFVAIIGVCYLLSSAEPVVNSAGGFFEDPFTLKLTDTGLYTAYIALAITIIVAIGSEIAAALK